MITIKFYEDNGVFFLNEETVYPGTLRFKNLGEGVVSIRDNNDNIYKGDVTNVLNKDNKPYSDFETLIQENKDFFSPVSVVVKETIGRLCDVILIMNNDAISYPENVNTKIPIEDELEHTEELLDKDNDVQADEQIITE